MKNKPHFFTLLLFYIFFIQVSTNCNKSTSDFNSHYNRLYQKQILFPTKMVFTKFAQDTVNYDYNTNCKILFYTDSLGCTICKMKLYEWTTFLTEVSAITDHDVSFLIIINPNKKKNTIRELRSSLIAARFDFPVCFDMADSLNKLNNFPSDPRFHCFLLDSSNRVILIGNPVQNPKIKELYLKTICECLGIEHKPNVESNLNEINFGTFSKDVIKTTVFSIQNTTQKIMLIDTVFTSCECTTAEINKNEIPPNENAKLTVTYTPDDTGDFYREVYVKVQGEEKPKAFAIRGNVAFR